MKTEFDESLTQLDVEEMKAGEADRSYLIFNIMAIVAFAISVFSPLTFLNWWLFPIPLVAIILGIISLQKTINSPSEIGGFHFAVAALIIATVLGGVCTGWSYWIDSKRVPRGYIFVDFNEMLHDPKTKKLPEKIVQLGREQRKVYIKGYMYQGKQMSGIRNFILVRTLAHCKFCSPEQNPTDMIDVYLVGGKTVNYRTTPVYVGGVLHVNENFRYGELPYFLEVDIVR